MKSIFYKFINNKTLIISIIWILIIATVSINKFYSGGLSLNEIGDFVTGMIAPLSILWFIRQILSQDRATVVAEKNLENLTNLQLESTSALKSLNNSYNSEYRPFLRVTNSGKINNPGKCLEIKLSLQNVGNPAYDVKVFVDKDSEPSKTIGVLDRGESKEIPSVNFKYPMSSTSHSIRVESLDGLGAPLVDSFIVKDNGKIIKGPTPI